MEFADLILSPKIDHVTLSTPFKKFDGTLCLTGHHMIVSSKTDVQSELWLLHSNVDVIERKQCNNVQQGGSLLIKCKDLRILQLDLFNLDDFTNVAVSLDRLTSIDDTQKLYPFFYRSLHTNVENGWTAFCDPQDIFSKVVRTNPANYEDGFWRITHVNADFKVCRTYPGAVIVPKSIDDDTIRKVAAFRDGGRFSVLSYYHVNGSILMRSSQPMTGTSGKRCREDEKLLNSLLAPGSNTACRRGYIFDMRSSSSAQTAMRSKGPGGGAGGGFESEVAYPQWRRLHKPLPLLGTASLMDSFAKFIEACNDKNCGDKFLAKVDNSDWLGHVKNALNCACLVAQCLDNESSSILIHDGESLDYVPLVCSLTQIILNSDTRTVRGFEALIEREWLQAGYPFGTRHQRSGYSATSNNSANAGNTVHASSPTFILFLDCVQQIHRQFPSSFEFNLDFLITLFEHSYASEFGTFLCDCQAERKELKLAERTVSIWSYFNRIEMLATFMNSFYEPHSTIIWPSVAPVSIHLWSELYLRCVADISLETQIRDKSQKKIKEEHNELQLLASELRKQLLEMFEDELESN